MADMNPHQTKNRLLDRVETLTLLSQQADQSVRFMDKLLEHLHSLKADSTIMQSLRDERMAHSRSLNDALNSNKQLLGELSNTKVLFTKNYALPMDKEPARNMDIQEVQLLISKDDTIRKRLEQYLNETTARGYSHKQIRSGLRTILNQDEIDTLNDISPDATLKQVFATLTKCHESPQEYILREEARLTSFTRKPNTPFRNVFNQLETRIENLKRTIPRLNTHGAVEQILHDACFKLILNDTRTKTRQKSLDFTENGQTLTAKQLSLIIDDIETRENLIPNYPIKLYDQETSKSITAMPALSKSKITDDQYRKHAQRTYSIEQTHQHRASSYPPQEGHSSANRLYAPNDPHIAPNHSPSSRTTHYNEQPRQISFDHQYQLPNTSNNNAYTPEHSNAPHTPAILHPNTQSSPATIQRHSQSQAQ